MKLYFAGASSVTDINCLVEDGAQRALLSYHYIKKNPDVVKTWGNRDLFIDSGAFSAKSLGAPIAVEDYADWLLTTKPKIYANLDVIGDYRGTAKNQDYLESRGLTPLPVMHANTPEHEIRRLFAGYDYLAFGGLVPLARQRNKLMSVISRVFSIAKDFWPIKIHGFGMTGIPILKGFPWYSVDSTSYLATRRFGHSQDKELCPLLDKYRGKTLHWRKRITHEVHYYSKVEREVTQIWTMRGISWEHK